MTNALSEGRYALLVATARYSDPKLQQLRAPAADADRLAAVLRDATKGNFEVEVLLDESHARLTRRIAGFFRDRRPDDLLLLHFSCHGVKDDRGELYLATADTEMDLLSATGVSAAWLNDQITRTRSRRTVVLLDCCFSGSFPFGMRARAGDSVNAPEQFEGRGRAIITASSGLEYAYEGDQLRGEGQPSVFTEAVVDGLETGKADLDHDQLISVDELYGYVYDRVKASTPSQTPNKKSEIEGPLYLAASSYRPPIEPATLDRELLARTEDRYAGIRIGAVQELTALLASSDPAVGLAARQALEKMTHDDSRQVSASAQAALAEPEPEPEPEPVEPIREGGGSRQKPNRRVGVLAAAVAGVALAAVAVKLLFLQGSDSQPNPPPTAKQWGPGVALDNSLRVWVSNPHRRLVVSQSEDKPNPWKIPEGVPRGLASDKDGHLYVAVDHGRTSRVIRLPRKSDPDTRDQSFFAQVLPGASVKGVAIGPNKRTHVLDDPSQQPPGGLLWLSDPQGRQVIRVDTRQDPTDIHCVDLGTASPQGLATSRYGRLWIVDSTHGGRVIWLARNGESDFTVKQLQVGANPRGIAIANNTAWITYSGTTSTITRIRFHERSPEKDPPDVSIASVDRVKVGRPPIAGVVARGAFAWVVNGSDGKPSLPVSTDQRGIGPVQHPTMPTSPQTLPLGNCH